MVPIGSALAIPGGAADAAPTDRATAASQLEAFFLRRMLAEARSTQGDMLSGGFAGDTFHDMLDGALADTMAEAGGIGLAQMFEGQLGGGDSSPPATGPGLYRGQQAIQAYGSGAAQPHPFGATSLAIVPVDGPPSSGFGARVDPITGESKFHTGLDLAAPAGTQVQAAGAGRVVRAERAGSYGNLVVIQHPDGLETRYAHLEAIHVKEGDDVLAGADIGAVGTTGRSTGPHLHFEVHRGGKAVDPGSEVPALHIAGRRTNR